MLVTDPTTSTTACSVLRDHGRPPGDRMFCNTEVGYKYKMSSLQAALGLAQLERVDELIDSQAPDLRLVRGTATATCRADPNYHEPTA